MEILPINADDLIHARSVESLRLEYKSGWDETTKRSTIATICAFANDLMNLNGGYVILGIDAPNGVPVLPPKGLPIAQLERIQKEIRGGCKQIDPEYQPLVAPTPYKDAMIIILWVPAGDNRPYCAPDDRGSGERHHYIRHGGETVIAKGELLRQLIEQTARTPFDDRRNTETSLLDLSPLLVKRFLQEIASDLLSAQPPISDIELYKALRIVTVVGESLVPKNIGLLFFNETPERFFPGVAYDVVQFGDDAGGNLIEERRFSGPINATVPAVIDYVNNLTSVHLRKLPHRAKVDRMVAYPYEALEEAIVNASYHRGYEGCPEPNKVYLYPDRIEITSYPGPVAGILPEHLTGAHPIPAVPARNRRIGEFLKEVRLAEMRGTGIPKIRRTMAQNGSPDPVFEFDPERTYFRVVLPAHPRYVLVHSLRESSYLWSIGERQEAVKNLRKAFRTQTASGAVAGQLIEFLYDMGETKEADEVFSTFQKTPLKYEVEVPYLRYFKILFGSGSKERARQVLESLPEEEYWASPVDVAIAFKRLRLFDRAHSIFSRVYSANENDSNYVQNYAQTKMAIATELAHMRNPNWSTMRRLQKEAIELLRQSLSLSTDRAHLAWSWFDLARCLSWEKYPSSQIREAYENAISLLPEENIFKESYERWKGKKGRPGVD